MCSMNDVNLKFSAKFLPKDQVEQREDNQLFSVNYFNCFFMRE